jgi:DNA invertase Pin-like site-specific DNA recombinase
MRCDHQLPERLGAIERGQRVDADLGVVAFHLARGGGEVVGGERRPHVVRGHAERRHAGRIEPDAHGEGLAAENLGVGDPVDRLQARLDDASQVVGDLGRGHHLRVERQIHEREALAGLLDHDRIVGVARQEAAHLIDLGQSVRHRPVGIGVETQIERDCRGVLLRGRDQRVDSLGARHRLLDRGGDEALDDVGRGAGVGRGDGDRGVRGLGKLPHLKPVGGHSADQQNEQTNHGRQHRPADEEIGECLHFRPSSGMARSRLKGTRTMVACYSYVRFSSKKQMAGGSLERQTKRAANYVASHPELNLKFDDSLSFQDLGVSGYRGRNITHGELSEFLDAVKSGLVEKGSYLIVENLDRVSRLPFKKAARVLQDICDMDINVVTLSDQTIYTKDSDVADYIRAALEFERANKESARKSEFSNSNWQRLRTKAAATNRVMSNNAVSWLIVEGEKDDRRFVINEEKATTVRMIAEMFLSGKGCQAIARALNDGNVPMLRNGAMWHPRSVHSILTNPAIAGRYVMGEKARQKKEPPIDNYYPALISVEQFNEISLMLNNNGNVKNRAEIVNPLAGLCFCFSCDSKMTRDNNINKGRTYEKLICSAAKVGKCSGSYKSIDLSHVFDQVKAIVFSEKLFDDEVGANKLSQLKFLQAASETQISQALELMFLQGHSKALGDRLKAVEAEKADIDVLLDIEAGKVALSGARAMNDRLKELKAAITGKDVARVNGLLRRLFSRITVDPFTKTIEAQWMGD